jgi:hypothetical protein
MDLEPYLDDLRNRLVTAAEPGGPEAHELAERLTATLDSAFRLAMLDALAAAAAEITQELAPGSVEVRLRGRDPEFVVLVPPTPEPVTRVTADEAIPTFDDDSPMTRINLRLGQDLKERVEDAARRSGMSVNAWLVRSATVALTTGPSQPAPVRPATGADHYRGWVR